MLSNRMQAAAAGVSGLRFVGASSGSSVGDPSASLTALSGGLGTTALEGDIVIAVFAELTSTNLTMAMNTTGYTKIADLYPSGGSVIVNLGVFWKIMGVTPDTTCVGDETGAGSRNVIIAHVWRGADQSTPIDVTTTTATGINSAVANPPSITPDTTGAVILTIGAFGATVSVDQQFTTNGLDNFFEQERQSSGFSCSVAASSYAGWTSGAYDPPAFGLLEADSNDNTWAAASVVLRPA